MNFNQMYHLQCYRRWRLARTVRRPRAWDEWLLCRKCRIWQHFAVPDPCLCSRAIPAGSWLDRFCNLWRRLWAWLVRIFTRAEKKEITNDLRMDYERDLQKK
jgi:hypothetical protein